MKRHIVATVFAIVLTFPASSQSAPTASRGAKPAAPALAAGAPAPPLEVERFLKGDPITAFEKGKVYVVEFWATWCRPCIQAMPHLSDLQSAYKDRGVTIIGTNVRELRKVGAGYEESFDDAMRAKVESFVRNQGAGMAYTVAYDGGGKAMDHAWLKASGSESIPQAFIVDRSGAIAWFGHPMVLRMPLDAVARGTWDSKLGPESVKQAEDAYLGAMRLFTTDVKAGLAAWDEAAKRYPILAKDLLHPKYEALLAAGDCDAAYASGEMLFEEATRIRDAGTLNSLAWSVVNPTARRATRNLDLAFRAATRANELAGGKDAGIMDTLARVHFSKGEIDEAIRLQSKAVELADDEMKPRLAPALEEYRKARR